LTTATEKIADQSVVSSQINENRRNFLLESELFEKYCTLLKDCISSDQLDVQLTTLQSIYSVLQNPKLCGSFAQELGTSLFSKLKPYILGPSDDSSELDLPVIESLSQQELNVIKETIGCFESILTAVAGDKSTILIFFFV
jgi:hypothetical protein